LFDPVLWAFLPLNIMSIVLGLVFDKIRTDSGAVVADYKILIDPTTNVGHDAGWLSLDLTSSAPFARDDRVLDRLPLMKGKPYLNVESHVSASRRDIHKDELTVAACDLCWERIELDWAANGSVPVDDLYLIWDRVQDPNKHEIKVSFKLRRSTLSSPTTGSFLNVRWNQYSILSNNPTTEPSVTG
jgi:hypothetical protein